MMLLLLWLVLWLRLILRLMVLLLLLLRLMALLLLLVRIRRMNSSGLLRVILLWSFGLCRSIGLLDCPRIVRLLWCLVRDGLNSPWIMRLLTVAGVGVLSLSSATVATRSFLFLLFAVVLSVHVRGFFLRSRMTVTV